MNLKESLNEIEVKLEKEIHMCKICGLEMSPEMCIFHKENTGHNDFRPVFKADQELKGDAEK
jgi:hypothetical protein